MKLANEMPYKSVKECVELYNSTAKELLKPLPEEMPSWFGTLIRATTRQSAWKELVNTYGTPPLQELPSFEELEAQLETERNSIRLITKKTVDNIPQPKIQIVIACEKFKQPNPHNDYCMNCGKHIGLH